MMEQMGANPARGAVGHRVLPWSVLQMKPTLTDTGAVGRPWLAPGTGQPSCEQRLGTQDADSVLSMGPSRSCFVFP